MTHTDRHHFAVGPLRATRDIMSSTVRLRVGPQGRAAELSPADAVKLGQWLAEDELDSQAMVDIENLRADVRALLRELRDAPFLRAARAYDRLAEWLEEEE